MAGVSGVKDVFFVKETADTAGCLLDFEGSRGFDEFGGEVSEADMRWFSV